jgi:hypothetical protein
MYHTPDRRVRRPYDRQGNRQQNHLPLGYEWIVLALVYELAVSGWIFAGFGVSLAVAIWVVASYLGGRRVSLAESVSNDGARR